MWSSMQAITGGEEESSLVLLAPTRMQVPQPEAFGLISLTGSLEEIDLSADITGHWPISEARHMTTGPVPGPQVGILRCQFIGKARQ